MTGTSSTSVASAEAMASQLGPCDCDGNVLDECGICGGDGIPAGDCDCNGNQLDALGECGGSCEVTRMPTASATTLTLV